MNLPPLPDLLVKIENEKNLNCTLNILEGQIIEDAHIELEGIHFPYEECLSFEKVMCTEKEPLSGSETDINFNCSISHIID